MCLPSANLVATQMTNDLPAMAEDMKLQTVACANHAAGGDGANFAVPPNLAKKLENAKKYAAAYAIQCKAAVKQLRLTNRCHGLKWSFSLLAAVSLFRWARVDA